MPEAQSREATIGVLKLLEKAKGEELARYEPSPKQRSFHTAGAWARERSLLAGNQLGKSFAGSREVAFHTTGLYPDWWEGKRYSRPVACWASGVTNETTRDNVQNRLVGPPETREMWGTAAIPRACLDLETVSMNRACSNLIDTIRVKHVSGSFSTIGFKSYNMGREKWQGPTLDLVWFDEEPPIDIYSEGLTRTNLGTSARDEKSGIAILTCTPLLGMTDVMAKFYPEPDSPKKHLTQMDIYDLEGILYSSEQIEDIIDGYPDHEKDARAYGIPMMGTGRIFKVDPKLITEPALASIPEHWLRIAGIDIGIDHPSAIVHAALEPMHVGNEFTYHLYAAYKASNAVIDTHVAYLRTLGIWIPVAWPSDAHQRDRSSGKEYAAIYRGKGANMLPTHAQFPTGGYSVNPGIETILGMMQRGQFKVAEHLVAWFDEFRQYHRAVPKNATVDRSPQVVKRNDDLLDATRYSLMMSRYAKTEAIRMPFRGETAGMDYNPIDGMGGEVIH